MKYNISGQQSEASSTQSTSQPNAQNSFSSLDSVEMERDSSPWTELFQGVSVGNTTDDFRDPRSSAASAATSTSGQAMPAQEQETIRPTHDALSEIFNN